tara:strand:- start:166 stop:552 length:387 start_codon:yes stop_codon:yes gene_type:complete
MDGNYDDWENEDWENEDFVIPILNTAEQNKKLEERRLIEESNKELVEDLFLDKKIEIEKKVNKPTEMKREKRKKSKSTLQNELKQKEISKKNKEIKLKKQKEIEIFGGDDYDDEYLDYEDKCYNKLDL